MKKIPIGLSDFKELLDQGYYFVDKSLLIEDVMQSGKVVLMTRPRRFGKTLNLSMLRYFFEISDQSNAHLFKDLAIQQNPDMWQLQGKFPVIFISFKSIKESSWEVTYEKFEYTIYEEFDRHKYLLTDDSLEKYEKELFTKILERKASRAEIDSSLLFLAKLLEKKYKKKVIVLIDEYDVPVQAAFVYGYYEHVIEFLRALLVSVLKDTTILEKGVLTGNLTLAKSGIFTGLNNLDIFGVTSIELAQRFGFTQNEIEALLAHYGLSNHHQDLQQWYDGYTFGNTAGIFNPWSALKCIQKKGVLEMYWANTSDNVLLKRLLGRATKSLKSDLELILQGKSVTKTIEESITFPNLDSSSELLWSLLLFTGYLTYSTYEVKKGKKVCELMLPNEEIKQLYYELIKDMFVSAVAGERADELLQALTEGNTEFFTELLQSFILNSMSSYDLSSNEPEKSYHLFVLGLLVVLSSSYEIKSNRESGLGRYDIMLIPKDLNQTGIVIEFKKTLMGETREEAAQKALDQIAAKKYMQELESRGVHTIIAYGIAFEGKLISMKSLQTNI